MLPEGYTPEKKYPLFLTISVLYYTVNCLSFAPFQEEGVIFADITPKGITLGNHIGEAALLEQIEQLKRQFSVDEERIYLTGLFQRRLRRLAFGPDVSSSVRRNHPSGRYAEQQISGKSSSCECDNRFFP